MKKENIIFLKTIIVCLVCLVIFVGLGYFYLNSKISEVEEHTSNVPYYSEEPENVGILVEIGNEKTFFFLDFYYKNINVIFNAENLLVENNILGYQIDHYIRADFNLLSGIIDNIGGIELDDGQGVLRYTGVQIADILSTATDYDEIERATILEILQKISENGFQKNDFLFIIENSETTLTVPICYYWPNYIREICGSVNQVN